MVTTDPVKLRAQRKRYRVRRRERDPEWAADENVRLNELVARTTAEQSPEPLKRPTSRAVDLGAKLAPLLLSNPVTLTAPAEGKIIVESGVRDAPKQEIDAPTPVPVEPKPQRRTTEPISVSESVEEETFSEDEVIAEVVAELTPQEQSSFALLSGNRAPSVVYVGRVLTEARRKAERHPDESEEEIVKRFWDEDHRAVLTALLARGVSFDSEGNSEDEGAARPTEPTVMDVLSGRPTEVVSSRPKETKTSGTP